MRKPICLHCGEKLIHFGRGHKYAVLKFNGGFIHFHCYQIWQYQKSQAKRILKKVEPTVKKKYNRAYYLKHREEIIARVKENYQIQKQREIIQVVV